MDFVSGFPKGRKGNDTIWVIVDQLTKSALFLPIKMTNLVDKLPKIYINEVVRLHGIPVSIVLDRDPRFTSRLWPSIQQALGTRLDMSTAFHPQMDQKESSKSWKTYYGPRVGPVAYKVNLPPQLAKVHDVFHVSLLRKADMDPARVIPQVPVEFKEDLTLEMRPIRILDQEVKELRNKKIPIVRILWRNAQIEEETWEREAEMRKKYPDLFELPGMECETP
ncbi:uncharacterized protein LOC133671532 [Populus nigra]|uniref:uncharacterized protein LOC133671532 n=1 Tax=Populus nigra TaxID=3691 RepID=UPI002B2793A0|nr:uncharacterized protein LOC133671532 [Populus nigra]